MTIIDGRMKGFAKKATAADLSQLLEDRLAPSGVERIDARKAADRVLADDVVAPIAVPHFDRAAVGGYALRSRETVAVCRCRQLVLEIVGDARPGEPFA